MCLLDQFQGKSSGFQANKIAQFRPIFLQAVFEEIRSVSSVSNRSRGTDTRMNGLNRMNPNESR